MMWQKLYADSCLVFHVIHLLIRKILQEAINDINDNECAYVCSLMLHYNAASQNRQRINSMLLSPKNHVPYNNFIKFDWD